MKVGFIGGKFLPLHQGHVYAIMKALSMVDKLYVVLSSSEKRDREICCESGIKYAPANIRLSWLGELVNDLENVEIIHIEDSQGILDYDWESGSREIKKAIPEKIDYIFSSETIYDDMFKVLYPESEHIIIDSARSNVNISATEIRNDLYGYWEKLPSYVRSFYVKRVVVVGTESCGKSMLVKKLAKSYNTNYCHEVGRDYCEKYSNNLTNEMFNLITMEHYVLQEKLSNYSNKILFVDSDAVITKFYLGMYLDGKSDILESIAKHQNYDLVLYLEHDVPWVDDGIRFSQKKRDGNNNKLKNMYKNLFEYISIDGNYMQRFEKAKKLVDEVLN